MSYLKLHAVLFAIAMTVAAWSGVALADSDPLAPDQPLGPTKVAITLDDLPSGTSEFPAPLSRIEALREIIKALKTNRIQPYGFANGNFMEIDPGQKNILQMWLAANYPLGNHTYNHLDLDLVGVKVFLNDIAKEDDLLAAFEPSAYGIRTRRVFRYPYLSEGTTPEMREAVHSYLSANRYRVAEVTTDYNDWAWSVAFDRCTAQQDRKSTVWLTGHVLESADRRLRRTNLISERMLHFRIPQILLLHFNSFTARTLGGILEHWRKEGVQFVSLDEALAQPIYRFDPKGTRQAGLLFLDKIALSLGINLVEDTNANYTTAHLNEICKAPAPAR
jgi:peptidoglycan/xylan/chitin deacetylase (PgdA/CDA1 family)